MANEEHLRILKSGVQAWNDWREGNPDVEPDLSGADLRGMKLKGAQLQNVNFTGADIRGTDFHYADLIHTKFTNAIAGIRRQSFLYVIIILLISLIFWIFISFTSGIFFYSMMDEIFRIFSIDGGKTLQGTITILFFIIVTVGLVISIKKNMFYNMLLAFMMVIAVFGAMVGIIIGSKVEPISWDGPSLILLIVLAKALNFSSAVIRVGTGAIPIHEALDSTAEFESAVLAGTLAAFTFTILLLYIIWEIVTKGNENFTNFRKIIIFFGTYFGTRFHCNKLKNVDFTGTELRWVHFDYTNKFEPSLFQTCWKDAKNMHLAYYFGTPLENKKVRKLLVSLDQNTETDFNGVNLQGSYLVRAALRNADLRNSDLDGADLSQADITGAKLYATSRENWEIEGIKCEYIYWDEEGKERFPPDRDFEPGEFEKFYKQLPTFEYFFEQGFTPIDACVMNEIVENIKEKHPEFELQLDSFHSRGNPHARFTVIHKEYVEKASTEIKTGFETQIKVLEGQRDQLMHVIAMLTGNPHAQLVTAVEGMVQRLIDNPRIQAQTIQGLIQAGHIENLDQKGGDMSNDTINIHAGGDVAFAKDQAFAQINKTISESPNINETLEAKLKELSEAVNRMTAQMPEEQAKEVTQDLQNLTTEAAKDQPRQKWYQLSGQGLIEAAKTVGAIGKPVIESTKAVLGLLAP